MIPVEKHQDRAEEGHPAQCTAVAGPFIPFDVDGVLAVAELEDIRWDRPGPAGVGLVQQHLGHEVVWVASRNNWAVVLILVRDWKRRAWQDPRFVLTRWRRERGAWRLFAHFRMPAAVAATLSAAYDRLVVRGDPASAAQDTDDG